VFLPNYGSLGEPTTGYVSPDGRTVTDWHGQFMGRITTATKVALTQWSHVHGSYMLHYTVNINGVWYWGRGSAGLVINLRPYAASMLCRDGSLR
jgi:hypothetical protein